MLVAAAAAAAIACAVYGGWTALFLCCVCAGSLWGESSSGALALLWRNLLNPNKKQHLNDKPLHTQSKQQPKPTQTSKQMGWWNLFTRGLPLRILMVGTLTGLQWGIYDAFKVYSGLPTTGAAPAPKK